MIYKRSLQALSLMISLGSLSAEAALLSRAGGTMIYDTVQDVTWVADVSLFRTQANASGDAANYVQNIITGNGGSITSGDGTHTLVQSDYNTVSGRMNWWAAKSWVATLNYGGVDTWRLPSNIDVDNDGCNGAAAECGYFIDRSLSEAGYMHYDNLGLKSWGAGNGDHGVFGDGTTTGENNIGLVKNLQSAALWLNNEDASALDEGWYFNLKWGSQDTYSKTWSGYVPWAVADGDVAPVPLPGAVWLFGLGLMGLARIKRNPAKI